MIIIFVPSIMKYTWQCIFAFVFFKKISNHRRDSDKFILRIECSHDLCIIK